MIKKVFFILIWALCFYLGASIVVGAVVGLAMVFAPASVDGEKAANFVMIGNAIAAILFFLAIFLGIKGKLPGTRDRPE